MTSRRRCTKLASIYRAKEERSAGAEIDKAISWLQYAQEHANKATAEEISTARYDLMDFSTALKSGKPVLAKKLDAAFAHASAALAKHHYFESDKAIRDDDLKTAGKHLMAAADLMRNAAQSANLEYGSEAYDIYDGYAPYGYWDDTIVFEKSKLESNLTTVKTELDKLATKLGAVGSLLEPAHPAQWLGERCLRITPGPDLSERKPPAFTAPPGSRIQVLRFGGDAGRERAGDATAHRRHVSEVQDSIGMREGDSEVNYRTLRVLPGTTSISRISTHGSRTTTKATRRRPRRSSTTGRG